MTVLVIAAHPDDEALGCGGTMARHAAAGEAVHVLFLADGVGARDGSGASAEALARRTAAAAAACQALGAMAPRSAGFPDNRLDGVDLLDVVKVIEEMVKDIEPQTIYTHHGGDLNVDHRRVHEAVLTACRPQPGTSVRAIYAFEVPSSTEWSSPQTHAAFVPNRFVDISAFIDAKRKALEAYDEEMRPFPHARSMEGVEALARVRGVAVGVEAAEAFTLIREVIV